MSSPGNGDTGSTQRKRSLRLVVKARAKKAIDAIEIYLESQRAGAGRNFLERLFQVFGLLTEMPLMGRMARSTRMLRKGYRCFVVDDYLLYYKATETEVIIYHVIHAAREADAG